MYAELQMELETKEINYRQSSNLQGVIMENISPEYAARLHGNQLNPYSQCITRENNSTIWTIKTLNEEAYENIIMPLSECTDIFLRKKGLSISVCEHLGQNHQIGIRFGNHSPGRPQIGRRIFPHHVELTQSHFQFHIAIRFFTKIKFPATRFFSFDYPKYLSRRRATAIANVTQAAVKFLNVPPYVLG